MDLMPYRTDHDHDTNADIALPPADLVALSTADLRRELASSLHHTVAHFVRLAWIVRLLEERGEDLSDLRSGLLDYLRRIAYGQVLPEIVVRFASSPAMLRRIAALPLPDQRRIAAGETVPLVVWGESGRPDVRQVDPAYLAADQMRRVFGPNGLRSESEQIVLLEAAGRVQPRPRQVRVSSITADCRRNVIRVGRTELQPAAIVQALAALAANCEEEGADDNYTATSSFTLTERQQEALKAAAHRGNTTVSALVRRALGAYGLFAKPKNKL